MKTLLLAALVATAAAPSFAQDFFGLSSEDVQGMIGQAKAAEHQERLKELGHAPSRLPSIGRLVGLTKTLTSPRSCVFDAVAAKLGVPQVRQGTEFPDVLLGSEVDGARYQAAVKAQFPASKPTTEVVSIYLPDYGVIYLADSASAYPAGTTIDDALAAQYARFIDDTQRDVRDRAQADADAASVQAWYRAQYPAGRSSCRN